MGKIEDLKVGSKSDKKKVKAVFIIPFYDKDIKKLFDTISSIKFYTAEPHSIVCINDCKYKEDRNLIEGKITSQGAINFLPIFESHWPRNTYGSLFCKKYQGMEFALKHFVFDFFVNMDTDALVTGPNLFECITQRLRKENSNVGILGSYKIRADGRKRTRWQWALYILYLMYIKRAISKKSLLWKNWMPKAIKNGYKLGEHMLGGAFIMSQKCFKEISRIYSYEELIKEKIFNLKIGDDVLFSLLVYACNFKIADFAGPKDQLAIAQYHLPINKTKVVIEKKLLIHSVKKGLNGESDEELRKFFRDFRKLD